MSVYIKGMEMPVDCLACRIACDKENYGVVGRPPKCPLEEAHVGDLISRADALAFPIRIDHYDREHGDLHFVLGIESVMEYIENLPSAELVLQTPQTYGKSINPSNAEVVADYISREEVLRELNGVCSNWEDDAKVAEIINALQSAEGGDAEMNEVKSPYMQSSPDGADLISRADAIEAVANVFAVTPTEMDVRSTCVDALSALPSADAERPKVVGIDYSPYRIQTTAPSADVCTEQQVREMRLIDANAIDYDEYWNRNGEGFTIDVCQKAQRIIDEQPTIPSAEAVQGDGKMIPIELKKRYPHSRDEDITDAFMRGYQAHGEAVQGEWIFRTDIPIGGGRESAGYVCSNCRKDYFHVDGMNFCPNCGAKMKGADNEID